ncbi:MAG TPA: chemotaxis protein CheA, partial [bacterium]|nr:chemotaxis protein CheA [bacterium]
FYVELTELLQFSEEALLKLEENHNDKEVINSLFRYIHSIKGSSGFLNLIEVVTLTHFAESLLDRCRNNELNVNDSIVSVLLEVIDCVKKLFRNMLLRVQILKGEKITEQINKVYIKDYLEKINKILIGDEPSVKDEPVIKPKSSEQPSEKIDQPQQIQKKEEIQKEEKPKDEETQQPQNTASSSVLQSDTIRVAVEKIDKVYEMLGELIISISLLKQSKRLKDMQDRDIDEKINYLEMISDQLQLSILKMRMFPIKNVYDKLKRQVRDLIKKSGKKVEFTTIGAEIELDKIVIEEIYSPLMHTVRNSMDHGIEKTEERKAKGKNEVGIIEIKAENRGDNVVISIRDDGAGLNKKKILEKALKNKLISEKDELTDMQIYNLIFQPGFSTAEQVTEISGRGVGMDVVKKTVMSLGGRIEIETSEGLGTKFEIILPLSTSIIDGLIVKCGNSHLIFPIKKIKHTLICEINDIKNVAENKGKFIVFENKTVPLIDLSEFYKIPKESLENFTALILEYENQYYALIVDEILYKQKIVTKNLTDSISNICGVKAGTILGDGTIGLIIEPNEVIEEYLKVKE